MLIRGSPGVSLGYSLHGKDLASSMLSGLTLFVSSVVMSGCNSLLSEAACGQDHAPRPHRGTVGTSHTDSEPRDAGLCHSV